MVQLNKIFLIQKLSTTIIKLIVFQVGTALNRNIVQFWIEIKERKREEGFSIIISKNKNTNWFLQ